jgi:hypothetical protein
MYVNDAQQGTRLQVVDNVHCNAFAFHDQAYADLLAGMAVLICQHRIRLQIVPLR